MILGQRFVCTPVNQICVCAGGRSVATVPGAEKGTWAVWALEQGGVPISTPVAEGVVGYDFNDLHGGVVTVLHVPRRHPHHHFLHVLIHRKLQIPCTEVIGDEFPALIPSRQSFASDKEAPCGGIYHQRVLLVFVQEVKQKGPIQLLTTYPEVLIHDNPEPGCTLGHVAYGMIGFTGTVGLGNPHSYITVRQHRRWGYDHHGLLASICCKFMGCKSSIFQVNAILITWHNDTCRNNWHNYLGNMIVPVYVCVYVCVHVLNMSVYVCVCVCLCVCVSVCLKHLQNTLEFEKSAKHT